MKQTTPLSILALLTLSFLSFKDIKENRDGGNVRLHIRILSVTGAAFVLLLGLIVTAPLRMDELLLSLAVGNSLMLMYPCSYEKPDSSFKTGLFYILADTILFLLCSYVVKAADAGMCSFICRMNLMLLFLAVFFLCSAAKKLGALRGLFRNMAVWHNLEDYSRFLYLMLFLVLCFISFSSMMVPGKSGSFLACLSFFLLLGLYVVVYIRASTGRTLVLSKEKEDKVKDMIKGNLRTSCVDKVSEDTKMNALYKRVMDYMTVDKPYLDESFEMSDMAEKLFTNKLYLSRTINILSGRNFRQFINFHRVQYAIELIKKDPRLKISEVSEMSGFHTVVSFNMAFKINMGQTPSDWMRDYVCSSEYLDSRRQ